MTKSRLIFLLASCLVVVPLLSSGFAKASAASDDSLKKDSLFKYLSVFTAVLELVRQAYVEEPDLRVLMGGALDGATDALDPFSTFVPAEHAQDFLANRQASRELSGMVVLKDRGVAWVVALDNGGPAEKAGLHRGDIISELGGVSTRSMPLWRIHEILSRKEGTRVQVETVRSSEGQDFEIVLARERPPATTKIVDRDGLAYLRLSELKPETVASIRQQLPLVGERPLLIDVRGVAGGDEEAAYAMAGLFATGKLGELRARDEVLGTYSNDVAASFHGKVVVLQDRSSLGAAEVLSAVLGNDEEVTILGETSFGHAGRMGLERLSSGGVLEYTLAYYTGPDGEPIDEGIVPDLRVRRRFLADEENADELYLKQAIEAWREAEAEKATAKAAA